MINERRQISYFVGRPLNCIINENYHGRGDSNIKYFKNFLMSHFLTPFTYYYIDVYIVLTKLHLWLVSRFPNVC